MTGAGAGAGAGLDSGTGALFGSGAAAAGGGSGAGDAGEAAGSSFAFTLVVLVVFAGLRAGAFAAFGAAVFVALVSFTSAFGTAGSASTVALAAGAFFGAFAAGVFVGVAFGFTVRRLRVLEEGPFSSTAKGSSCSFIKLDLLADRSEGRWRKFEMVAGDQAAAIWAVWPLCSLDAARALLRPLLSQGDAIFRRLRAAD